MNTDKITSYLDSLLDRDIPSVDCVIYENHEIIYRHMNGFVDAEKKKAINGNEMYLMFSMTKVQTMTAIMQLIEKGLLSLEDDVAKYLPAYNNLTYKDTNDKDTIKKLAAPLKIKHLVSMSSGLDYDLSRPGIVRVLNEQGNAATTLELVNSFAETPLDFIPGSHFAYSLSHDVAAAVVEVVSGRSFGQYLADNIWKPLHMDKTLFAKPMNDDIPNLAAVYINEDDKIRLTDTSCMYQLSESYESGGAGLISCLADYSVFADTLACGGVSKYDTRILKAETIEIMKQNLLNDVARNDLVNTMGRKGYGYGCGVQVFLDPESVASPAPKGVFGWDGAAGSCIIMDTASHRSLVYIMHVRNCGWAYSEIHPTLRDLMYAP